MEQFGISNFGAFILAGIVLNITPGSDTFYILTRSIAQGRYAGILSALGISTGGIVHTVAAAFGLSLILSQSAFAFHCVKFAGAAYLVYLGIRAFFSSAHHSFSHQHKHETTISLKSLFFSGVMTNVLNPKVALFFLAFLPQFITPDPENGSLSFLILGCTFVTTGTIWGLCLAYFSSIFAERLSAGSFSNVLAKVSGTVFIALGIRLALEKR